MTQSFSGIGSGLHGSSIGQLGNYGPIGTAGLGQGGESVYVNIANGNVVLQQKDGFLADFDVGLDVFQTYNSRDKGEWCFNTETSLQFEPDGETIQRMDEDGHISRFVYDAATKTYLATDGSTARLTLNDTSWDYREGNGLKTLHYNGDGQLSSLCDRDGHELHLCYQNGQLVSMTDTHHQQSVIWSYTDGLLTAVTFQSDGETVQHLQYTYDEHHRLNCFSRMLSNGEAYWIAYDYVGDSKQISDIRESDGTVLHLDFDEQGRIERLVDGEGRTTVYDYEVGRTTIINALGERWTYHYDAEARLIGLDSPGQFHARYHYNGQYLDEITQGTQRWQFSYNDKGDCVRIDDPSGSVCLREYDNEHHLIQEMRYQAFDGEGHPTKPLTTHAVYDAKGHLRFEVFPDGTVTEHRYDVNGRRVNSRCYLKAEWSEIGVTEDNLIGWVARQRQDAVSLTAYQYDAHGNVCAEIHYTAVNALGEGIATADAIKTFSRYDATGRCIETSSLTDTGLTTTHYLYDALGRLIQTIDNQQQTERIEYDALHQRILKTAPNGLQTLSIYDKSGLLLSQQRLDAQHDYGTITYQYDVAGRLIAETDVDGQTRHLFYDTAGRLQGSVSGSGIVMEYGYDVDGHCIITHQYATTINPQNITQATPFKAIKPPVSTQDQIQQTVYNAHQQIAYQINAEGAVIAYHYDLDGHVILKTAYAHRLQHDQIQNIMMFSDIKLRSSDDDRCITYYYDARGRLQADINGEGVTKAYRYDRQGNLIVETRFAIKASLFRTGDWRTDAPPSSDRDLHLFSLYNQASLKIADIDADGYLTEYVYDARALRTEMIAYDSRVSPDEAMTLDTLRPKPHPNDHHTRYRYNDLNQCIEEKTSGGLILTTTYDAMGLVTSQTRTDSETEDSRQQQVRYDALGRVSQRLDERDAARLALTDNQEAIWAQYSTRYTYDIAGRVTGKTNAENQTTRYFYNESGQLTYTLNPNGAVTETRYNSFQQVETTIGYAAYYPLDTANLTTTRLQQTLMTLADEAVDDITHYLYNAMGLLVSTQKGNNIVEESTYNAFGERERTAKEAILTHNHYDRQGLLQNRIDNTTETQFSYDNQGNLLQTRLDPNGLNITTDYAYNARGLLLRETHYNDAGANQVTAYTWDAFARCTSKTLDADGLKLKTIYAYDQNGNLISQTDANQHTTRFVYNANGQLRFQVDARGVVTEHVYDALGDKIRTTSFAHLLLPISDDDVSTLSAKIQRDDARDHHQFFLYDKLGRISRSYDGLGNATTYGYDANGNVVFQTQCAIPCSLRELMAGNIQRLLANAESRTTYFAYDGLNRERFKIDEEGRVTESIYNAEGLLQKQTRYAIPHLGQFSLDFSITNIQKHLYTDPTRDECTQYHYDNAGRLTFKGSAEGIVTAWTYDKANNPLAVRQYNIKLSPTERNDNHWVDYIQQSDQDRVSRSIFDSASREVYRISASGHVVERRLDGLGNVIQEITYANTLQDDIVYTAEAVKASLNANNAHSIDYDFDALGRLLQKTEGPRVTRYTYDNNHNVTSKTDANQTTWTYRYNESNQQIETIAPKTSIKMYRNGQWLNETRSLVTRNEYDAFGNLTTVICDAEGLKQITTYVYDQANRKIQALYPHQMVNQAGLYASNARLEAEQTLSESWVYNAFGEVLVSFDRSGNASHSVYDNVGRLIDSIDAEGGVIEYEYDVFDNVIKKTKYNERLSQPISDYSRRGIDSARQISAVDRHEYYRYDKENRLIETQKDAIRVYDSQKNQYDWLKPTTQLTYNAFGDVVTSAVQINRCDWAVTTHTFDKDGLKTSTLDAEHYLTAYTYNDFGLLESETQFATRATQGEAPTSEHSRTVTFLYDALGNMTHKTQKQVTFQRLTGNGSHYEHITRDLTSRYAYDAMGNLVATTDAEGNTAYAYYNATGQVIAKVGPSLKACRSATTYTYDALGHLMESRQWANGALAADAVHFTLVGESSADILTRDVVDIEGHVLQQTDGSGHSINTSYDANGNVSRTWQTLLQADGSTRLQDKRYTYSANNHLIETATLKANGERVTDNAVYNAFGEVIQKGVNGVYTTQVDYDTAGHVWRSNTQGYYQLNVYDLAGNVTQVVTSTNAFAPGYGEQGLDLSERTFETATCYDKEAWSFNLQRQNTVYNALGFVVGQNRTRSFSERDIPQIEDRQSVYETETVDRWGNVLSHTNVNGFTTQYEYDALNHLVKQTLPEVKVVDEAGIARLLRPEIHTAFDALGRAIAMSDANGNTVAKVFDAVGHITQEIDALGQQRDKMVNLLNQLTSTTNERGGLTTYTYDNANRLQSIETASTTQQYRYDGAGHLIAQTDGRGNETQIFFDDMDNVVLKTQSGITGGTSYEYDALGRKTLERDANGHVMTWRYDDKGRLLSHTDLGGHQTDYTYNRNGLLLSETSTSGKNIQYHYFSDGNISEYDDVARDEVVRYSYDAAGNVLSKESDLKGEWHLEKERYQYDALGRLMDVTRHHAGDSRTPEKEYFAIRYEYDAVGNIRDTQVDVNDVDSQHTHQDDYFRYDANNRMVINKGQLQNGNIQMTQTQGSELEYDASGNIKAATKILDAKQSTYTYLYSLDNQLERIQKEGVDLSAKRYENGVMAAEMLYDTQGHISQHNIMHYENGRLLAQVTEDGNHEEVNKTQYQYDAVGNVLELKTDILAKGKSPAATQIHRYDYELWEGYQQKTDNVVLSSPGIASSYGKSERTYDVNGQLQDAIDTPTGGVSTTTHYFSSSQDGVHAREDKNGKTSYLTVAGKTIGDVYAENQHIQHLTVYGGFTPFGSLQQAAPGQGFANKEAAQATTLQTFHNEGTPIDTGGTPPEVPQDNLGAYTLQAGDTLDSLALQLYGDSSLWYLIADANGITDRYAHAGEKSSSLHVGQRLTIPQSANGQHHTSQTHKVLQTATFTGNLSASVSSLSALPPAPPPHKRHHAFWKTLGKIVMVVASAAAMMLSAGVFAAIAAGTSISGLGVMGLIANGLSVLGGASTLGTAATLGVSLSAGFVSSLAGQGVANAFHLQKGIDFKSAFMTGLATAATAGIGKFLNSSVYSGIRQSMTDTSLQLFSISNAAEMMERDTLSQGINLAFHNHQHFDWLELGVSGVTAGVMGGQSFEHLNQLANKKIGAATAFISTEAQSLATGAAMGGHFDAQKILTDNLGHAVSAGLAQSASNYTAKRYEQEDMAYCAISEEGNYSALPEGGYQRLREESEVGAWKHDLSDDWGYGSGLFSGGVKKRNELSNVNKIDYNDLLKSEEFRVYLSTIPGAAGGQSPSSWEAVGHVINNRVGYREWSKYKTPLSVIENTGFDAYSQKTNQYQYAYHSLSTGKLNSHLTNMMHVVAPVYLGLATDTTNGAVLYYSPRAQAALATKSLRYKPVPDWHWEELNKVYPVGVKKDDFAFYKYK